jgi:Asp-tRNA(Asn)/Glu-tRNA(Gln) amidotransferase A subunit family amidase
MTSLTDLTIAGALKALAEKKISAVELCQAHNDA